MNLDDDDTVDELPPQPRCSIPEADRKLLGLAARALGAVRIEDVDGEEWLRLHFADGSVIHGWNPLRHSDDAFNLAVRLCIKIEADRSFPYSKREADARRAVTRAAAEIGKCLA